MENYLPIGVFIGLCYLFVTYLNLYFHFTKNPLLQGMFEVKEKADFYINLLVMTITSIAICFTWPFVVIFFIMNLWASDKTK